MKTEIIKTPIGVLVLQDGELIDSRPFSKNENVTAAKMRTECAEERELLRKYPDAVVGKGRVDLAKMAEETDFCKSFELPKFLSRVSSAMAKKGVSEGFGLDKQVAGAVRAAKLAEEEGNTQSELLREWYSMHFPELSGTLRDNEEYARVVSELGARDSMTKEALEKVLTEKKYARIIPSMAESSIGAPVDKEAVSAMKDFAKLNLKTIKGAASLKTWIEASMVKMTPNLSEMATPYVGALLLEEAGSLKKLAGLPASTIQVLGAQKAMFRFLKTKRDPPKYGVLYIHPLVAQAPKSLKGKIARTIAAKIAIAVKVDFYDGEPIGKKLYAECEERVKRLK